MYNCNPKFPLPSLLFLNLSNLIRLILILKYKIISQNPFSRQGSPIKQTVQWEKISMKSFYFNLFQRKTVYGVIMDTNRCLKTPLEVTRSRFFIWTRDRKTINFQLAGIQKQRALQIRDLRRKRQRQPPSLLFRVGLVGCKMNQCLYYFLAPLL